MKINKLYILIFIFSLNILQGKSSNYSDSVKIANIEIYVEYFNASYRYQVDSYSLMKTNWSKSKAKHKQGFNRVLSNEESIALADKICLLLKSDTISSLSSKSMDLRFLMVLNYDSIKPSIYIGIEGYLNGYMFINGKRYKRDKMILVYALDYITDKEIKKHIKKIIKNWKDS